MTNEPFDEKAVFNAARCLASPDERLAHLQEACAQNPDAQQRILDLLRVYDEEKSFLEPPSVSGATADQLLAETPGMVIGPYKLLEPIGEGGMGTVWMAQQTMPVKRMVALKLIKAGLDSKQVVARFEAERQALALMDHANIARVLDAGATAAGRPYFVMDLVKGVPITRYCDEHRLTPLQRLELFVPICHAVQHAHQKGIIHRDLKPSNVLVALYDGKPVPKVIDFGVAKAAGQPLTDKTLVTGFGNIVGTLEYMSPEQAEINQLDIDTRSDIYSLGVLLYELLTGTPPFSRKDLEKAGMLEMLRVIREQEPSKPSMKLSSSDALATLSANRATEPAKLAKLVRGELDWIVMKALEKDRNRRYETANGLALDVQRYLADEPVLAGPPSVRYRLKKFLRRNKGPVLAASLVLLTLVGGIIGTTLGMLRAINEQNRADAEIIEKEKALQQKGQALQQKEEALVLVRRSERQAKLDLGVYCLDKGLDLCVQGDVELGVLWLARSLESAPQDAAELRRVVRMNLAAWQKQLSPLRAILPQPTGVRRVGFSADGNNVLTIGSETRVWDAATGMPLKVASPKGRIAASSRDGKSVLIASDSGKVQLWNVASGQPVGPALECSSQKLIISEDSRVVVTYEQEQGRPKHTFWEAATGKPLGPPLITTRLSPSAISLSPDASPSTLRAISPDGHTIMVELTELKGSLARSKALLWDVKTGKPIGDPLPIQGSLREDVRATFSPDGRTVATFGLGIPLQRWDAATGKQIVGPPFKLKDNPVILGVAISPDGNALVTWDNKAVILRRLNNPSQNVSLPHADVLVVAYSADGKTLVTASRGAARLWDVATGLPRGCAFHSSAAHKVYTPTVAFSPNGRTVAIGAVDGTRLWEVAARQEPPAVSKRPQSALEAEGFSIRISAGTIALSPNGETALMAVTRNRPGDKEKTANQLWDVASGKPIGPPGESEEPLAKGREGLDASPQVLFRAALSLDGNTAIVSNSPKELLLWREGSWTIVALPEEAPESSIGTGSLSSDGKLALLRRGQATVRLWEVGAWRPLGPPLGNPSKYSTVALSPDGTLALTVKDLEAQVWEARTGKSVGLPLKHQGPVATAAFSPDGRILLTGSNDKTARLWEVATGKPIGWPLEHPAAVTHVAFSPDGGTIVTGHGGSQGLASIKNDSSDGGLTLTGRLGDTRLGGTHFWDVATGKPLGPPLPRGPLRVQNSVAFSADGATVVMAGGLGAERWQAPVAVPQGPDERLVLWAQVHTQRDLDDAGVAGWQTAETWQQRRQRLLEMEKQR